MVDSWWVSVLAGLICGIFSGLGIGGGSLLMVWMTAVAALDQRIAQGINLMYFLPTAAGAFFFHWKQKTICWKAVIPAAVAGCIFAAGFSWIANTIDVDLLKKLFGVFLIIIGIAELRKKKRPEPE